MIGQAVQEIGNIDLGIEGTQLCGLDEMGNSLSHLSPPLPGALLKCDDIVLMDNLPAHKVAAVHLIFGSATSNTANSRPTQPDLNPIEDVFAKLKALITGAAKRTIDDL